MGTQDRAEEQLLLSEARLRALYELMRRQFDSEQEMVTYAIEEVVRLTGSKIGYFYLVSDDQVNLELFTWTKEVTATCSAPRDRHYPLEAAGVWADCLRHRRPLIHNDYQDLSDRKGYPEGHPHLVRHLSVPIFDGDKAAIIAGVGNKETPYDDNDVLQAQLFMNEVWKSMLKRRADEALRESEKRYRTVIETSPDAIVVTDLGTRITMVNQQGLKIFGYDRQEEVLGLTGIDLVPESEMKAAAESLREVLERGRSEAEEFNLRRRDGSIFPAMMRSSVLEGSEGKPAGLITIIRDISKRKRAEVGQRESEERYRLIAENAEDMIWLTDLSFKFTYISPSMIRLSGYSFEELSALPLDRQLTPDSMQRLVRVIAEEVTPERLADPKQEIYRVFEVEVYNKDGSTQWLEHTIKLLRDPAGRPMNFLGVSHDINERKLMETRLRETEERYRSLFDRSLEIVFVIDFDGNFLDVNSVGLGLFGYSLPEARGLKFTSLLDKTQLEVAFQTLAAVAAGTNSGISVFRLRTRDGRQVILEAKGSLLYREGRPYAIQGIARDITERVELEEQLKSYHAELELKVAERTRELEKAQEELIRQERLAVLGQLAGSVGHEILNPLGAIKNASYFLQMTCKDPDEKVKKHLQIIDREVNRSKKIVTDLLSLTRTGPRQRIPVDFPRLLEEALAESAIPDWITVARSCEVGLPSLELDPAQVKQALVNIIVNARQALEGSGTSPRIKVSLDSDGAGGIRFVCEDNGPGISSDLLPRIFEPLVSTKTIGFGLGLTVCRQMTYINGGEVRAENSPSGGALFTAVFRPGAEAKME